MITSSDSSEILDYSGGDDDDDIYDDDFGHQCPRQITLSIPI